MTLDQIRESMARYKGKRDTKYYMLLHLLKMVELLADSCADYASMSAWTPEQWAQWASAQAADPSFGEELISALQQGISDLKNGVPLVTHKRSTEKE